MAVTGQLVATQGALRVFRGCLLAGTSGALAVAAHACAGGGVPDAGLTLLLTAFTAAGGVALARRRLTGLGVLVALGCSHLGMHLILSAAHPGMADAQINGTVMLVGHVLALLLAALLVTKAEVALFAVAAALSMLLPRRVAPLAVRTEPSALLVTVEPADRILTVLLRRACARRGPPLSC